MWRSKALVVLSGCVVLGVASSVWSQPNSDEMPRERAVPILPGSGLAVPVHPGVQPVAPILVEPADQFVVSPPEGAPASLQFRWQPGAVTGSATSYRVCVFEATKTCQEPGSEIFTVAATVNSFAPPSGLPPAKFLGKSLKWSVDACVTLTIPSGAPQAVRPGAVSPPTAQETLLSMRCASSPARLLHWTLSPPQTTGLSRSVGIEPAVPHYGFFWTPVTGARAYYICLYDGPFSGCVTRSSLPNANPMIVDVGGAEYRVTSDLPQFRGRQIRWTVAACTHIRADQASTSPLPEDLRCTWQPQPGWNPVTIQNPLLPPTLNAVPDVVQTTLNNPPELKMTWQLNRAQDVRSVKVCIVTARGPGGMPVAPEDRARVLAQTSPSACEQRNVISNPVRSRTLTSCTVRRPFPETGDPDRTVFGFAVAACNESNQCWYSAPMAVVRDEFRPFGGPPRCE